MLSFLGSSSGMTLTRYVTVWAAASYLGVSRVTIMTVSLPVLPPADVCALAFARAQSCIPKTIVLSAGACKLLRTTTTMV